MHLKGLSALLTVLAPALVVLVQVEGGGRAVLLLLPALVGLIAVAALSRRPDVAILLFILFVPAQQLLLALLLHFGAPVPVVRGLGLLKEAAVAALVVAAVRSGRGRSVDALDVLSLAFLGIATAYLVAPFAVRGLFADVPFDVRLTAFRYNVIFVVAFLAARRVGLGPAFGVKAVKALVGFGVVAALVGFFEVLAPDQWSRFLTQVAHLRLYRALVFDDLRPPTDNLWHITVAGHDVIRMASITATPLSLAFFMMLCVAVCAERIATARHRVLYVVAGVLSTAAVVATLARSAILGALLVLAVVLRLGVARQRPGRLTLGLGAALAIVLVAPFAGTSAIGERANSTFAGDVSAQGHKTNTLAAVRAVVSDPLGRGLGTSPAVGERFAVKQRLTSENAYLQVGAELGVLAMVVFVVLLVLLLRRLRERALLGGPDEGLATAVLAAGCGLAFIGLFLHVWLDLGAALTFWSLAGVALAKGPPGDPSEPVDDEDLEASPEMSEALS